MPRVIHAAEPGKVTFAREQRQQLTAAEAALWEALRDAKLGARFRRQHPIRGFVLDFYCDKARLAVELDGEHHGRQSNYDAWRDSEVAKDGIRVLRIRSEEVHSDLPGVVDQIRSLLSR